MMGRAVVRIVRAVLSPAVVLMPLFAFAQGHVITTPSQLVWKPLIPGVEMAVVSGDPDRKGGLYVIRIRTKGQAKVPPHWHPNDEHVTVAGAHYLMPATMRHFGLHKAGNVVEVYGEGPFAPTFVNPEDDPSRAKTK
jgi:hypothetical protein